MVIVDVGTKRDAIRCLTRVPLPIDPTHIDQPRVQNTALRSTSLSSPHQQSHLTLYHSRARRYILLAIIVRVAALTIDVDSDARIRRLVRTGEAHSRRGQSPRPTNFQLGTAGIELRSALAVRGVQRKDLGAHEVLPWGQA